MPPTGIHGTPSTYQRGCRCDECRGYNAAMRRRQRASSKKLMAYDKGRRAALYIAANRYREEHPKQWQTLLNQQIRIATKEGAEEPQVTD